jgi:arylsulfatase
LNDKEDSLTHFLFNSSICGFSQTTTANTPNIIYILADDLGYGELGCYGQQKIKRPNIDALAKEGKGFTRHYAFPNACTGRKITILI